MGQNKKFNREMWIILKEIQYYLKKIIKEQDAYFCRLKAREDSYRENFDS